MHLRIATASVAAVFCLSCGSTTTPATDGGETPVSVKLSGKDESCTRTADCATDLICVDQTCVTAVPAPVEPVPTRLGGRGETCQVTADCGTGLVCWPIYSPPATGALGIGLCERADFGLEPTGKTCSGECKTSADCCEIPVEDQGTYKSCEDLKKVLGDGASSCETTAPVSQTRECFLYKTFCDCATSNPWTCNSGSCSYTKVCDKDGEKIKGCPSYSRTGRSQISTCNLTSNTCTASTTVAGCKVDNDCTTLTVADDATDTCSAGECVCQASTGGCYRRCKNDLECAQGLACDTTRQLCVPSGACDTDAFCATKMHNILAKCVTKTCKIPCAIDLECSGSGLGMSLPFTAQVCNAGYCETLGCASDSECAATSTVKTFCQTPPAASTSTVVHSAITN